MSIRLLGSGRALPERILTNGDLAKMVDTSDEWIVSHTGIHERRIQPPEETIFPLALKAAQLALEDAGTAPGDISLIICSTVIGADILPSLACQVMRAIGACCPAFDINAACTGFLYALHVAKTMATGPVLIVAAEQPSKFVDYTDRSINVLFGDGAGAVVAEPGDGLLYSALSGAPDTTGAISCPGANNIGTQGTLSPSYMFMEGQEVFKFATREMMRLIRDGLNKTGLAPDDLRYIIPHQANLRIIQSCSQRIGLPMERFAVCIDRYGNTSSASIPIALDELRREGKVGAGDTVLLAGFGGGWTGGCAVWKLYNTYAPKAFAI